MAEKVNAQPEIEKTKPEVAVKQVKMAAVSKEPVNKIEQLVKEVIKGLHGTGRERMLSLGDNYEAVQHEVNQLIKKGEI